jgi:hypothetical protein
LVAIYTKLKIFTQKIFSKPILKRKGGVSCVEEGGVLELKNGL